MTNRQPDHPISTVSSLNDLAKLANYSLMDTLNCDPGATKNGVDHRARQVFSGHYVPVNPTPIEHPEYVAHSRDFFKQLGFDESMATSPNFLRLFSGDLSKLPSPMRQLGWATGYALSIYGTEYTQQCPFQTGNGYGDGRAISVLEAVINGQRWEMQLKGAGPTPYCRGADGRAVLRSSIREFLAQDHMNALGVPTSRSLSLFVSKTEKVQRPWYSQGSYSENPDEMIYEAVAISTRVAPSFLRVGQLELFARRSRKNEHSKALEELEKIVQHLIDREYADCIDGELSSAEKGVLLAGEFRDRLSTLVADWIRVGFCQGNFNSDNCAAGGFTLDYGPFGFCDVYHPQYQPWTGGGRHFSFMNQPNAAQNNFNMFCSALRPLLVSDKEHSLALDEIQGEFGRVMQEKMNKMWAAKLGLEPNAFDIELLTELEALMIQTPVDYTMFFRELSSIPDDVEPLKKSFYRDMFIQRRQKTDSEAVDARWIKWFDQWKSLLNCYDDSGALCCRMKEELSEQMKRVNPKYILREWFVQPAYHQATDGDYSLIRELQQVMTKPYAEQSQEIEDKYYRLKPAEFFALGGVSHLSCSS